MHKVRRLIGLDPSLRSTGWGLIQVDGNRLKYIGSGNIMPDVKLEMSQRLLQLHEGLAEVLNAWHPTEAAVEETFVNRNASSTLKLGLARGVVLLAPALLKIPVCEYSANRVKKSVVGAGHATKDQVRLMVCRLLPGSEPKNDDESDALAIAICHAHFSLTNEHWQKSGTMAGR